MKTYKSFSLPGGGVLRVNTSKIIATVSAPGNKEIEIYIIWIILYTQ